jgi:hypothetical protein
MMVFGHFQIVVRPDCAERQWEMAQIELQSIRGDDTKSSLSRTAHECICLLPTAHKTMRREDRKEGVSPVIILWKSLMHPHQQDRCFHYLLLSAYILVVACFGKICTMK